MISAIIITSNLLIGEQQFFINSSRSFKRIEKSVKHPWACRPDLFRKVENIIILYRSYQLLQIGLLSLYGPCIVPIHSLVGQITVLGSYILITSRHRLDNLTATFILLLFPATYFGWMGMLTNAGGIFDESKKFLLSWKRMEWKTKMEVRLMAKYRKSCPPLYFGMAGYMKITRKTVLKFTQGVVRGTFRSLLALK